MTTCPYCLHHFNTYFSKPKDAEVDNSSQQKETPMKTCSKCKFQCKDTVNFCPECGNSFENYFSKPMAKKGESKEKHDSALSDIMTNSTTNTLKLKELESKLKKNETAIKSLSAKLGKQINQQKKSNNPKTSATNHTKIPTDLIRKGKFWRQFDGKYVHNILRKVGKPIKETEDRYGNTLWHYKDGVKLEVWDGIVSYVLIPELWDI